MLRITKVCESEEEAVLRVDGWVVGDDVGVLEREGTCWLEKTSRLVLDLADVRFIDETGIALLERWHGQGLVLRGGSRFIRALLKAHGLDI